MTQPTECFWYTGLLLDNTYVCNWKLNAKTVNTVGKVNLQVLNNAPAGALMIIVIGAPVVAPE